jgi:catechol 2,3-dioxygenase-like lactoylglutathione lyase family enzyme
MFRSSLHHVGIIVADREQVDLLMKLFGLELGDEQYVPEYEAQCYFTRGAAAAIEFIVPSGGKLKTFNKGFGGIHHIALEVEDLEQAAVELEQNGVKLLEQTPVDAGPILINFVPPLYTRGFIVELVQRNTGKTVRSALKGP